MPRSRDRRSQIALTRRGRLLRTALSLLVLLLLTITVVLLFRALAAGEDGASGPAPPTPGSEEALSAAASPAPGEVAEAEPAEDDSAEDAAEEPTSSPSSAPDPAAGPTADLTERHDGIVQSETVGDGTWTVAEAATASQPADEAAHSYALRVENGIDIDAAEAAAEVAAVLADPRGWQTTDGVFFQQVDDPEQADFTISIASPPTVDELCAPARTGGVWSCRIGPDVALNSDRWQYLTPTYDDPAEYRAYLVNHEVGHYLGHQHVSCGGEGLAAPVMLQQSIDLEGCRPNAWPAHDGQS